MKKTVLGLIFCLFVSTFLAFSIYADSPADFSAGANGASLPEAKELYYEDGLLKIYVGELTELDSEISPRPAYYTRKYDLPFYVVYGDIELATLTAHLTTVGLDRDWCFHDSGSYTYDTHVGMVNVLFWEPNTVESNFIQAAFKVKYINTIIGPQAIRFYCNSSNGAVTW